MSVRMLPKAEWKVYFDSVSRGAEGDKALVEVGGALGRPQPATKWLPLIGMTYEPKEDVLEIALEGFDHLIRRPKAISVHERPEGVVGFEIVDGDEQKQIVNLKEPISLSHSK